MSKILESLELSTIGNYVIKPTRGPVCYAEEHMQKNDSLQFGTEYKITLHIESGFKVATDRYFTRAKENAKRDITELLYAEQLRIVRNIRQLTYELYVPKELSDLLDTLEHSMMYT